MSLDRATHDIIRVVLLSLKNWHGRIFDFHFSIIKTCDLEFSPQKKHVLLLDDLSIDVQGIQKRSDYAKVSPNGC